MTEACSHPLLAPQSIERGACEYCHGPTRYDWTAIAATSKYEDFRAYAQEIGLTAETNQEKAQET
jgi:hypothetical protein